MKNIIQTRLAESESAVGVVELQVFGRSRSRSRFFSFAGVEVGAGVVCFVLLESESEPESFFSFAGVGVGVVFVDVQKSLLFFATLTPLLAKSNLHVCYSWSNTVHQIHKQACVYALNTFQKTVPF